MAARGEIIYEGIAGWALDQDVAQIIDVPVPGNGPDEGELHVVYIRNGSATVSLNVDIGNVIKMQPSQRDNAPITFPCAVVNTGDLIRAQGNNVAPGDIVTFTTGGNGITAGTRYYAINVNGGSAAAGSQFQISTTLGGSAVTLSGDGEDTATVYPRTQSTVAAVTCTYQNSGDTITRANHGLRTGEVVQFTTTGDGITAYTDYYVITPTATTFQISATSAGSAAALSDDGTNSYFVAGEFFVLTGGSAPVWTVESSTASRGGLRGIPVRGFLQGDCGRIRLHKSAAPAAAFEAHVQVRRV